MYLFIFFFKKKKKVCYFMKESIEQIGALRIFFFFFIFRITPETMLSLQTNGKHKIRKAHKHYFVVEWV
jgi:hypothetical protein